MASLDDVQKRDWVIGYFAALTAVTIGFWLIRIVSRLQHGLASFGFDDFFIALSWVTSAIMTALTILGIVRYDFDQHLADIGLELVTSAVKYAWLLNILYLAQTAFAKISILLFYRRLVRGTYSPRFKWAVWVLIGLIVIYSFAIFALYMSDCSPIDAVWMEYNPSWVSTTDFSCASQSHQLGTAWTAGILAVVTDLLTVLLPSWLFVHIQLSSRARIALAAILALGFLVVIPSISRAVYLVRAEQPGADKLWYTYTALIVGKTEGDIGICLACAPSLNVFFRRFFSSAQLERGQPSATRSGTHQANQEPNRTYRSARSNKSILSNPSTRSGWLEKTMLSPRDSLQPGLKPPQVLKWSDKSMDNIPEAYAEDIGFKQTAEKDIESSIGENRKITPPDRTATAQSWLNLDPESSDDERANEENKHPDNVSKSIPHR